MKKDKEDIKNCPFCGSTAHRGIENAMWIFCDGCSAAELIEIWQKRKEKDEGEDYEE